MFKMSAPCSCSEDIDDPTNQFYEEGQTISVVGGKKKHLGRRGKIREVNRIVYVILDNGVHLSGPFTHFKLVK